MSITAVNDDNFQQEVLNSDKPVLVDFWAEWCGPCRQVLPMVEALAEEQSAVKVAKINIDENPATPTTYRVRSIPTLMIFKGGEVVDVKMGALPKSELEAWLKSHA